MTLTLDSKQESSSPNPAGIIGSMGCAGSILWCSRVIIKKKNIITWQFPDYDFGFPKGSKHYNLVLPGYNVSQKGSSIYYQDLIKLSAGLRLTRGKSLK